MAWCQQATSHYLSQSWPRSLLPYDITRPQWVMVMVWCWGPGNVFLVVPPRIQTSAVSSSEWQGTNLTEIEMKIHIFLICCTLPWVSWSRVLCCALWVKAFETDLISLQLLLCQTRGRIYSCGLWYLQDLLYKGQDKMAPFCRQLFQIDFLEWNLLYL